MNIAEAYSKPCQTPNMERFAKIGNGCAKRSTLNVWQGSEYPSAM